MLDELLSRDWNEKCLAISGGAVLAYFVLPPRRPLVALGVAVGTYIAIAWYDELYDCDERLVAQGGLFGAVTGPLKPAVTDGTYGGGMGDAEPPC